jgi:hypothetical protein
LKASHHDSSGKLIELNGPEFAPSTGIRAHKSSQPRIGPFFIFEKGKNINKNMKKAFAATGRCGKQPQK